MQIQEIDHKRQEEISSNKNGSLMKRLAQMDLDSDEDSFMGESCQIAMKKKCRSYQSTVANVLFVSLE